MLLGLGFTLDGKAWTIIDVLLNNWWNPSHHGMGDGSQQCWLKNSNEGKDGG